MLASLEAGDWVDEEPYEMTDFSPAVKALRSHFFVMWQITLNPSLPYTDWNAPVFQAVGVRRIRFASLASVSYTRKSKLGKFTLLHNYGLDLPFDRYRYLALKTQPTAFFHIFRLGEGERR